MSSPEAPPSFDELTPREIVAELDKYIVGQAAAKRAVAIALRNRVRRQKLPPELAEEILPKNILMIGPTGVGKTEIARRLARLAGCPFVKVEASKYTEVGYVGRDVESMIRDLVETAIDMVREEKLDEVAERAEQAAAVMRSQIQSCAGAKEVSNHLPGSVYMSLPDMRLADLSAELQTAISQTEPGGVTPPLVSPAGGRHQKAFPTANRSWYERSPGA